MLQRVWCWVFKGEGAGAVTEGSGRAGPRGTQRNRREREVLSTPQEGHVVGAWSWKKSGGGVLDTRRKWRALMEPHPD